MLLQCSIQKYKGGNGKIYNYSLMKMTQEFLNTPYFATGTNWLDLN